MEIQVAMSKWEVLFVSVPILSALLSGVYMRAPGFISFQSAHDSLSQQPNSPSRHPRYHLVESIRPSVDYAGGPYLERQIAPQKPLQPSKAGLEGLHSVLVAPFLRRTCL